MMSDFEILYVFLGKFLLLLFSIGCDCINSENKGR